MGKEARRVSPSRPESMKRSRNRLLSSKLSFPFYIALMTFFVAIFGSSTEAQSNNEFNCYEDLYLSDKNGDARVDAEEYLDFLIKRLENRRSEEGFSYDITNYRTFENLPSALQSNFYTLACFCSRFQFENKGDDGDDSGVNANAATCCVGENAHLSVVNRGEDSGLDEISYTNLLCDFTGRAIDGIIDSLETIQPSPTAAPSVVPTGTPTPRPTTTTMTAQPSMSRLPSGGPTVAVPPTISPSAASLSPPQTILPTSISSTGTMFPTPEPPLLLNITVKSVYSILFDDNATGAYDAEDVLIEAMDRLSTLVAFKLWYTGTTPTIFNQRFSAITPTTIDKILDVGFTSTPKLVKIDEGDESNETVFVGGPCPTAMMTSKEDENTIQHFRCEEVTASIVLEITTYSDTPMSGEGSPESMVGVYEKALEYAILTGDLAEMLTFPARNSTVVSIATGQIVSTTPTSSSLRIGIIIPLVVGSLLLTLFIVQAVVMSATQKQKKQMNVDSNETKGGESADTMDPEDPESGSKDIGSTSLYDHSEKVVSSTIVASSGIKNEDANIDSSQLTSFTIEEYYQPLENKDSQTSNSVSYLPSDAGAGSIASADDARSTGGISQESDAGWSEAYTSSSMGSISDDELPNFSVSGGLDNRSALSFPAVDIDREDDDAALPVAGDSQTACTPELDSPTPDTIQVLEDTVSEDDDELMIHEDNSDDDAADDDEKESNNDAVEQEESLP